MSDSFEFSSEGLLTPGDLLPYVNRLLTRDPSDAAWPGVLAALKTVIPCHSISLWRFDTEERVLTCRCETGTDTGRLDLQMPFPANSLPGGALSRQETLCIADAQDTDLDTQALEKWLGSPVAAALCVPLQVGASPCGELLLLDETVAWFSEDEARLTESVQGVIALALHAADLQQAARQQMAEREQAEEALRASQRYAGDIIESSLDMIIAVDTERRIIEFNHAAQQVFGYTPQEVLGRHISMLYAAADHTLPAYQHTVGDGEFFGEILNKRKNGEMFPCLLSASILRDAENKPIGLMGISRDITEQKRAEQIREALYHISEAAQTTRRLDDLYPALREIVGRLMPVENFYIAFYDADSATISYPYYVDQNQERSRLPRPFGSGLADHVLRTGDPLLLTPDIRASLVERGDMKPVSFHPTLIDWLGVPLKNDGQITGIITVQSHSATTRLGEEEQHILMFVSSQIAAAIARKQTEEESHKLRKAIETTEVGVTITDPEGNIVYVNPADAALHGYSVMELLGQPANVFTLPHLREAEQRERSKGVRHWKRERVNVRKDGSIFPVKLHSNPIYGREGEHLGDVTICEDITERKHAEKLLRESEQRSRSIVENAATGIFQATIDGRFITANPALARMLGYGSPRELMENITNMAEHLYIEPNHWHEMTEMIGVTQEAANVETRIRHRDGGDIIAQLTIWTVRSDAALQPGQNAANTAPDAPEQGRYYYEGFMENITERKQMEHTLFRHAALLHSVAAAMTGLLVNSEFHSAMTHALELLGRATEVDRIALYEHAGESVSAEGPGLIPRFTWERAGQARPLAREMAAQGAVTQGAVTQGAVAQSAAAQGAAAQRAVAEQFPNFPRWHAALQANQTIIGCARQLPAVERAVLEAQQISSLMLVPVMIRDQWWGAIGLYDCHSERQWREEEESVLLALAASIGGAIARQQAESGLRSVNVELTEALAHLKQTQNQLIQSEKMAALGQLVAGVAHEVNTPLGAIRSAIGDVAGTIERVLDTLPGFLLELSPDCRVALLALIARSAHKNQRLLPREERRLRSQVIAALRELHVEHARKIGELLTTIGVYDDLQEFLPILQAPDAYDILDMAYRLAGLREGTHTISTAVERASKVVFALKTYAHYDHSGKMVDSDLETGLDTVLTLYHNKLKHGVEVVREYAGLPPIACYPDELSQVWINLIHNALQAMEYRGRLTLHTEVGDDLAIISITDSGPGIPEDIRPHIFTPFFTTKPSGEGSGLGLDIVRRIVEKHQGDIQVQSQPGSTTFSVYLPQRHAALPA